MYEAHAAPYLDGVSTTESYQDNSILCSCTLVGWKSLVIGFDEMTYFDTWET